MIYVIRAPIANGRGGRGGGGGGGGEGERGGPIIIEERSHWWWTFLYTADAETQSDIDYLAKNLGVQYEVVNNFEKFDRFLAQVTFTNQGATTIKTGEWSIYLCIIYMAEPDHLRHNPSGYVLPGEPGLKFTHVDGCLHKLEPTKDFRDIPAGESLSFQYNSSYWSVSRTDVMPRWYVAAEGLEAKTLEATDDENLRFVEDFVTKQQWKRYREDRYDPYTPQERFQIDRVADLGKAPLSVIPTAVEISGEDESRKVSLKDEGWKIYPQKGLEAEAEFLAGELMSEVRFPPLFRPGLPACGQITNTVEPRYFEVARDIKNISN